MKLCAALLAGMAVAWCCGCSSNHNKNVEIARFDMASLQMPADSVLAEMPDAVNALGVIFSDTLPSRAATLERYVSSPATKVFSPDVAEILPNLNDQEGVLGEARERASEILPELVFPQRMYGYVTPYMQSVVIVDTVVFVGLNHYLGADYPGYSGFDEYSRALKTPERMPVDVVEALLYTSYPYEGGEEGTLLSRMLYEGVVAYAAKLLMPSLGDAEIMGFSPVQMAWAEKHEGDIWRTMAEKGLIYSVDPLDVSKVVAPAPGTYIISSEAPGRIGRYTGLKIVEAYIRNTGNTALADMLKPSFYNSPNTLVKAAYTAN